MLLKSNVFRIVLSFCLIFSLAFVALADTIRLKDGSVIKGRIVGFRDGQFTVQIGDGARSRQMTFFADEVADIEFDGGSSIAKTNSTPASTALPRPSTTPTNNAPHDTANNTQTNSSNTVNSPSNTTIIPVNTGSTQTANPQTPSPRPKPIQLNIKVLADNTANGWTNAGWVVRKGQKIKIIGKGQISLADVKKGIFSTPAGIPTLADKNKLMSDQPTGGLIAVIGDDNNDFIFIGNSKEFTAPRDGALFLGINEGLLEDNSGSYEVVIEIDPGT